MKKILLFILSCAASVALAAESRPQLGDASDNLLKSLIGKGITKIGDFDLARFLKDKKQIQWTLTDKELPFALTGDRRSAYFLVKDKKIFMSSELPDYSADSLAGLEMHESFGALGYDDKTYTLSSTLKLLSQVRDQTQLQKLLKVYGRQIFKKNGLRDSGTSVGGGGDLVALTAKEQVLNYLWKTRVPTLDFLVAYPRISFEPNYEEDQQEVSFYYSYDRFDKNERIGVTIPALLFEKGEAQRIAVMKDVLKYILAMFPAYPDATTYAFKPSTCSKNVKVTFPIPESGMIRQIQEFRAGMITGCDDASSISIRYPYFMPRKFLLQDGTVLRRK